MPTIKQALQDFNPWWERPISVGFSERTIYQKIKQYIPLPPIIAFTGLRRVGKTTLLLKIAADRIAQTKKPMEVVYFSFDEFKNIELREILNAFEEITDQNLSTGNYLVLFDEIQKAKNWEEQLKTLYDVFGKNTKFIISGSESLFIHQKTKQVLAGRIFEFIIKPLSFSEYITFRGENIKPIGLHEKKIQRLFEEYIQTQGFPELVPIKEKEIIQKYLKESIADKIIYQDIPGLFPIKNPTIIETLLHLLMDEPGQLIDLAGLSSQLAISRQTLSTYLNYLEKSFLLQKLYNFSPNARKSQRKLKKYYPTILSSRLTFEPDSTIQSIVFEWIMVRELNAEFFWRDPYQNEVDIVLRPKNPIEIKYGKIETKGIIAFMEKFKTNEGTILTHRIEERKKIKEKTIHLLPGYKKLLQNEPQSNP
ncbi:MAG: ATP-binding protein [Candidatus Diapherotrites archaeon]